MCNAGEYLGLGNIWVWGILRCATQGNIWVWGIFGSGEYLGLGNIWVWGIFGSGEYLGLGNIGSGKYLGLGNIWVRGIFGSGKVDDTSNDLNSSHTHAYPPYIDNPPLPAPVTTYPSPPPLPSHTCPHIPFTSPSSWVRSVVTWSNWMWEAANRLLASGRGHTSVDMPANCTETRTTELMPHHPRGTTPPPSPPFPSVLLTLVPIPSTNLISMAHVVLH